MLKSVQEEIIHDINDNYIFLEFYSKKDSKDCGIKKGFQYFSGVKNFTKEVKKSQNSGDYLKKLSNYINRFSTESYHLPFHSNITDVVLYFEKDICKPLNFLIEKNENLTLNDVNFLACDLEEISKISSLEEMLKSSFYKKISDCCQKSLMKSLSKDKNQINLNCLFLILDKLNHLHFTIVFFLTTIFFQNLNSENKDTIFNSLIKNKDNAGSLIEMIKNHLTNSYKIFHLKKKSNFLFCFPSNSNKVVLGDECYRPSKPVFKLTSKSQGTFERLGMTSSLVKNFENKKLNHDKSSYFFKSKNYKLKKIKIFLMSWNLAGYFPDNENEDICKELIFDISSKMDNPDLIIFNLQEIVELKMNTNTINDIVYGQAKKMKHWSRFFENYFLKENDNYSHFTHNNLSALGLKIFIRKSIQNSTMLKANINREFFYVNTGMPNKGFCLISLKIFDSNLMFINTHLPSGQKKEEIQARCDKVKDIFDYVSKRGDLCNYDIMFLAGDLNLRTFSEKVPESYKEVHKYCNSDNYKKTVEFLKRKTLTGKKISPVTGFFNSKNPIFHSEDFGSIIKENTEEFEYLQTDEVKQGKYHNILGKILVEGKLPKFPSYKFNLKKEILGYDEKRRPSWTDRIFYHIKSQGDYKVENDHISNFYIPHSDHM